MSLVAVCAIGLAAIGGILIRHPKYEDGLLGRIALAGIILAGVVAALAELFSKVRYDAPPELEMLLVCMLIFMIRHLYRFWRYTKSGSYKWTPVEH